MTDENDQRQKLCISCASPILEQALLCPTCKSYQKKWKNNILFISGIMGFLVFLTSGFLFIFDNGKRQYNVLFSDQNPHAHDIFITSSDSYEMTIANPSDRNVYISGMIVNWRQGSFNLSIGKNISPHSFLHQREPILPVSCAHHNMNVLALAGKQDIKRIYQDLRPTMLMNACDVSEKIDFPCATVKFLSPDSIGLEHVVSFYASVGKTLVTDEAKGKIEFLTDRNSEKQSVELKLIIQFLYRNDTPECSGLKIEPSVE